MCFRGLRLLDLWAFVLFCIRDRVARYIAGGIWGCCPVLMEVVLLYFRGSLNAVFLSNVDYTSHFQYKSFPVRH